MTSTTNFFRWLFCVILLFGLGLYRAQAEHKHVKAKQATTTPLHSLLNHDGTLNLHTGFAGSVDIRGWKMVADKKGRPHFVRTTSSRKSPASPLSVDDDNVYWDSRFQSATFDAPILALAVSGANVYVGGAFTMVGALTANHIAKWDGNRWSALGSGVNDQVNALAVSGSTVYAGGGFDTAGGILVNNVARWNGTTWSDLAGGTNGDVYALTVNGSNLYAGGLFTSAGGTPVSNIAVWNSSSWSDVGGGLDGQVNAIAITGLGTVYAGGTFVTAGATAVSNIAAWTGSVWTSLKGGLDGQVNALLVSGSTLYVGGAFTTDSTTVLALSGIAKWNGTSWSTMGSGFDSPVDAITLNGSTVYAGGEFSTSGDSSVTGIARWTGSAWASMNIGVDGPVSAIAVGTMGLLAGGDFTTAEAGMLPIDHLARWTGSDWAGFSNDLDGFVDAVALSPGFAYVGGTFIHAGGRPVNYIARWNGLSWSPMGPGFDGPVYAIAVSGVNVYAGGSFTTTGITSVNNIAKWNGTAWSAIGAGLDGQVNALAVSGSIVFVGGSFGTAGIVPASNIARLNGLNGPAWFALGAGVDGPVNAIVVNGSNVYVGGSFANAGIVSANNIARWDGATWYALGDGTDGSLYALATDGSNIFAGGSFANAGSAPANNVALWNGIAWSPLGLGVDLDATSMAFISGRLYVGGLFSYAGDKLANNIAKWNGISWSQMGTGVDGPVSALGVRNDTVYAGGLFLNAGDKPATSFDIWTKPSTLPEFAVGSSQFPFGDVLLGTTKTDSVAIYNGGGGSLAISTVTSDNAEFTVSPTPATIASSASHAFVLSFHPGGLGLRTGNIIFAHNASSSPDTVSVFGTGVTPGFSLSAGILDFGAENTPVFDRDSVTVTNVGTASLHISSVTSDNGAFTVTPSSCTINASDSARFVIHVSALCVGVLEGHIVFTHDAASSPDSVEVIDTAKAHGSISGTKFEDINANRVQDMGEGPLSGFTIRIRAIPSLIPNACTSYEDSAITDGFGHYRFNGLPDGLYSVSEKRDTGYFVTLPATGFYRVPIVSGTIDTGRDFGNTHILHIYGGSLLSAGANPTTAVEIDGPVSVTQNDTVLAMVIADTGSLSFALCCPETLTVLGPFYIAGQLNLAGTTGSVINCLGDWTNIGTFATGTSKISFTDNHAAAIDSSTFYDLEISGNNKGTLGNMRILDQIILHRSLHTRSRDTVFVENQSVSAIVDTGTIPVGTIRRKIAAHETGAYRFESPQTFVQFYGSSQFPPSLAMTTVRPTGTPRSFTGLKWISMGGTVHDSANFITITVDSVPGFSKWTGGGSGSTLRKTTGSSSFNAPTIRRIYEIKPDTGGSFLARLQLRFDTSEVEGSQSGLQALRGPVAVDSVPRGWNMVSLPVIPGGDPHKDSIFQSTITPAYFYTHSGYEIETTLQVGKGYWLKFSSASVARILGDDNAQQTVSVVRGWNMIGAPSFPTPTAALRTIPSGIISGLVFGYSRGYRVADSLRPMQGYWVKVSAPGQLVIGQQDSAILSKVSTVQSFLESFNAVTFRDNWDAGQTLYFGSSTNVDLSRFEMPPAAPSGTFDVRFSTGHLVELADSRQERDIPLIFSSGSYPLTITWDGTKQNGTYTLSLNGKEYALRGTGSLKVTQPPEHSSLNLSSTPHSNVPKQFALYQNYPNPFNPSTTIRFDLSQDALVTLRVFNILGQHVASVAENKLYAAGSYGEQFNTANLASGIYFYQIIARELVPGKASQTFVQTKKMILLR